MKFAGVRKDGEAERSDFDACMVGEIDFMPQFMSLVMSLVMISPDLFNDGLKPSPKPNSKNFLYTRRDKGRNKKVIRVKLKFDTHQKVTVPRRK